MQKKFVFLGMGGTIAGKAALAEDTLGYRAGQVPVSQLLQSAPGLEALLVGYAVQSEQLAQIDSKDMTPAHWTVLAQRIGTLLAEADVAAIVVTHGTDTLEESAYFLSCVLPQQWLNVKPVVLTCAMRPATAHFPDGPGNLLDSACVAVSAGCHGLLVVCAGSVHRAANLRKVHPYRLNPFDSGEAGVQGFVESGRVRLLHAWPENSASPVLELNQLAQIKVWPRVEIIQSHAGSDGQILRCLLQDTDAEVGPLRGLVIEAPGNASVHSALEPWLLKAQQKGIRVLRVSRCGEGAVMELPGAIAPAIALSAVKARIQLQLELARADQI